MPRANTIKVFDLSRGDGGNEKHVISLFSDAREYYTDTTAPEGRKCPPRHHSASGMFTSTPGSSAGCGYCFPEKSLFIAHWDCWRVVQASDNISTENLHEFALRTMPLALSRSEPHAPLSLFDLAQCINRETSLGRFIMNILDRIPPELHPKIMREAQLDALSFQHYGNMNDHQYKALLTSPSVLFTRLATVQLSTLPRLRSGFAEVTTYVPGKDNYPIQTMHIIPVDIFGATYIAEVGFSAGREAPPGIQVRSEEIRGVRFALGRFGLRGLRLLYADGSDSRWLGSTSGCWYGNVRGKSIRDLHVVTEVRLPRPSAKRGTYLLLYRVLESSASSSRVLPASPTHVSRPHS